MEHKFFNKQYYYAIFFIIFLLTYLILNQVINELYKRMYPEPHGIEGFVPRVIKEHYRPLERNIRIGYNNLYNKTSGQVSNLFKKVGIW